MATHHNISLVIPKSTLSRLPLYYSHIRKMQQQGEKYVSAAAVAQSLNLNPVLVRKDLSGVSSVEGKPRAGFEIDTLLNDLSEFLGYNKVDEAILVGVGSLGRLILTNTEFSSMGLDIAVGFDKDPDLVGLQIGSKYILPMEKMESYIKRTGVKIGIITVPADQAQSVCDQMVECGILAIWNFAFTLLNVPKGILVKNENLPSSLAVLSQQLAKKLNSNK
ncbi:MAG: redox-sensing transcriptional repressor Rex [Bacteroidales bacterium]|jgi:redox-sensing transcriptional repressor|nr:redox-sensing transcriptional repressor Rex [Bacteroidales bacterium]